MGLFSLFLCPGPAVHRCTGAARRPGHTRSFALRAHGESKSTPNPSWLSLSLAAGARQAASRGLVLGAQRDGAAIGSGGLGLVAEPLIGLAAGRPRRSAVRVGLHRLVEVGHRFPGLVERKITCRAAE